MYDRFHLEGETCILSGLPQEINLGDLYDKIGDLGRSHLCVGWQS